MQLTFKPFNVIDRTELPEVTVDWVPVIGDPLEIDSNMYIICELNNQVKDGWQAVGVIPLVYKNDSKAVNIENYLESLYIALRKMQDLRIIQLNQNY
jgi:hypothetical protein